MRYTRNPRYAPESLERKLSPSSIGIAPTVEVAVIATPPPVVNFGSHLTGDDEPPYDPPIPTGPFPPFEPPPLPPLDPTLPPNDTFALISA